MKSANKSLSLFYRLVPGIEWVEADGETAIFRSLRSKATLKGKNVSLFMTEILPLLDGRHSLPEIAAASTNLPLDELEKYLAELVENHLIENTVELPSRGYVQPMLELLSAEGRSTSVLEQRIKDQRIAVFGLESIGALLATEFARWGVRELLLIDPEAPRPDDPSQLFRNGFATRQASLCHQISVEHPELRVSLPLDKWDMESVLGVASSVDILVSAVDRDFSAIAHWVNKAALHHKKIAAFCSLDGDVNWIGPIVYPNETACFMCFRMRSIACEDDFTAAMAFEEKRDKHRSSSQDREPTFMPGASVAAGILASELLKTLTACGRHAIAGRVLEWDILQGRMAEHEILRQPNCPVCSKKNFLNPDFPPFEELSDKATGQPLSGLESRLVSKRTGIIRSLTRYQKAFGEPDWPRIYRAEIANMRFMSEKTDAFQVASGKGFSADAARTSAMGEAVERYSGSIWAEDHIMRCPRNHITENTLDPARLVLYNEEQYQNLPYHPLQEDSVLGWVRGRSFPSGLTIQVPAQPTLMSYRPVSGEMNLCQVTSNGLAAGPTLAEAAFRATLEVIERDAFISTWLLRLPCEKVDVATIPDEPVRKLVAAYQRRDVTLELYKLFSTAEVHCFVGLGICVTNASEPAVVVGLGADVNPVRAACSALMEIAQVRPGLKYRLRDPKTTTHREAMLNDPSLLKHLEDHDLYYAGQDKLHCFDFIRQSPETKVDWTHRPQGSARQELLRISRHLEASGAELILVNLTPPEMEQLGLYTARSFIPDFQPIFFGRHEQRLSEKRLTQLTERHLGKIFGPSIINPDPHPLA